MASLSRKCTTCIGAPPKATVCNISSIVSPRSYYSSEGCTGEAAQYDLVSTDCMVYNFPIGAYGTFECDKEGNA